MLKRRIIALTVVALMLLTPLVASAAAISGWDGDLEDAVRDALGFTEIEPIAEQDMRLLTSLNASDFWLDGDTWDDEDEVIRKLHGLQFATNLEALNISHNFIADITPISNLAKLALLDIRQNDNTLYGDLHGDDFRLGFSYNPSNPQMVLLNNLQQGGTVVMHDGPIKRISGPDRYNTAIRIWQNWTYQDATFGDNGVHDVDGAQVVTGIFLARGDDFADALAGVPLAYQEEMPILLTQSNVLNPAVKAAIDSYVDDNHGALLGIGEGFTINVLGGEAAVSSAVVNEIIYHLQTTYAGLDIRQRRYAGDDRFETSAAIAEALGELVEVDDVVFASGRNFPDALSVAPYAALSGAPILLVEPGSVPAPVADYLRDLAGNVGAIEADQASVIGGPAAISEAVIGALLGLTYRVGGNDVDVFEEDAIRRIWGADRYATAIEVVETFGPDTDFNNFDPDTGKITSDFYVATGESFPDALTGAWLAAMNDTGILLVRPNTVPAGVASAITDVFNTAQYEFVDSIFEQPYDCNLTILGGEAVVTRHNAVLLHNLVIYTDREHFLD